LIKDTNIISYLTKEKGHKQSDIALKLDVAISQISKWKRGVKIPRDKEILLMKLADIWWERDNDRPLLRSDWAILVGSKVNENRLNIFFKGCFEDLSRYPIASNLVPMDLLIENILKAFNIAQILFPNSAPSYEPPMPEYNWTPDYWQEFFEDYIQQYLELENWCCKNLFLDKEYMINFFKTLPELVIWRFINEDKIPTEFIIDPFWLHEYERASTEAIWEERELIRRATFHEGLDFDIDKFDKHIYPPQKEDVSYNPDVFDLGLGDDAEDVDILRVEDQNKENIDSYLSYGERKIMDEVAKNRILLIKVLKKLESL